MASGGEAEAWGGEASARGDEAEAEARERGEDLTDVSRGERRVVFILSNGRGCKSAAGAEARAPTRNGRSETST